MAVFEEALKRTLEYEGKFSNDPDDKGGPTNFGITHKTYARAVRMGIIKEVPEGVKGLTLRQARKIYRMLFWGPLRLDEVDDPKVSAEIFDTAVHAGTTKSARIVQRVLQALGEDLVRDGIIGPVTLEAINKWSKKNSEGFFKLLNSLQGAYYVEIVENDSSQMKWLLGWMKRVQDYDGQDSKTTEVVENGTRTGREEEWRHKKAWAK